MSTTDPVTVFVHVQYFHELSAGAYTVSIPKTPGGQQFVGETYTVERWASGTEAEAWAYACMQAACAAVERGYHPYSITIRGDRSDIGRLLRRDWDGQLGTAVLRYRSYFGDSVRFQHRAGARFTEKEIAMYRRMVTAYMATSA